MNETVFYINKMSTYDIRQKTVITAAARTTVLLHCIVFFVLVKNKSNLFFSCVVINFQSTLKTRKQNSISHVPYSFISYLTLHRLLQMSSSK